MASERIVLVTRQTELEALIERFQTRSQTEFYLTQAGEAFEPLALRHARYQEALAQVRRQLPAEIKTLTLERRNLPRYRFEAEDVVVALGPDGLVANIAKYLAGQPLIAVNPDPESIDGILLPVELAQLGATLRRTLEGRAEVTAVTMAEALLSDGQRLRAVNDLFVGARSHVSVRYRLEVGGRAEEQSSSGLIASTGVGSTGWLRSIYAGAIGIVHAMDPSIRLTPPEPLPWDADRLAFNVREPWPSLTSRAGLVSGHLEGRERLNIVSRMPQGGVIFGDGMENDYLEFNSGTHAEIGISDTSLRLVRR